MITAEGLRERIEWLRQQLADAEGQLARMEKARPKQVALPGLERPKSIEALAHYIFAQARKAKLEALGAWEPDENLPPAGIIVMWRQILPVLGEDIDRVHEAVDNFFALDWPAKKLPPYPFSLFAAPKVWRKCAGLEGP